MTKPNPLPSLAELNDLLDYDPETGIFTWKKFVSGTAGVGSIVGTLHPTGYIHICINRKKYPAHRLAYKMYHGSDPVDMIDHIDCDKTNNRIANLRDATNTQNKRNTGLSKNNTSGIKGVGVNPCSRKNPWRAQIEINNKCINLGSYKTKEEAALAYEKAAKEYFGEFARTE
jgi:hypothetical protein